MTETAEDRSKRRFCQHLDDDIWRYQVTIFLTQYSDRYVSPEIFQTVRKRIARCYREQPFLWRIGIKAKAKARYFDDLDPADTAVTVPYMTLYTDRHTERKGLMSCLSKMKLPPDVSVWTQYTNKARRDGYIRKVKLDDPHDLKAYFDKQKVNRFGLLNIRRTGC
jgi:hypothetical protein